MYEDGVRFMDKFISSNDVKIYGTRVSTSNEIELKHISYVVVLIWN